MKTIICPYYIVNNDEERQKVLEIFGKEEIPDTYKKYPYIIGKEPGFIFQTYVEFQSLGYSIYSNDGDKYVYQLEKLESCQ